MEVVVTARFTGGVEGALSTFMNPNPVLRHNLIFADATKDFLMNAEGTKINVCQKPLQVYEQLLPVYLKPGATVLVAGFGAGGEIGACIAGGYNCVAFESDPIQFKAVSTWLLIHDARIAETNAKRLERGATKAKAKAKRAAQAVPAKKARPVCHVCTLGAVEDDLLLCWGCDLWFHLESSCSAETMVGSICRACETEPADWHLETK